MACFLGSSLASFCQQHEQRYGPARHCLFAGQCPPTSSSCSKRQWQILVACRAEVTASLKGRNEPRNFEAQGKRRPNSTTKSSATIRPFEFLLKANHLKPDDINSGGPWTRDLDAGHYDVAEKWYRAAILKKSGRYVSLAGLRGGHWEKVTQAAESDCQPEKVDLQPSGLTTFKGKLASLKAERNQSILDGNAKDQLLTSYTR